MTQRRLLIITAIFLGISLFTALVRGEDISLRELMKSSEQPMGKEELLIGEFNTRDQIILITLRRYLDHPFFKTSLTVTTIVRKPDAKMLDLILHYKEYIKTEKSNIDGFIDYLLPKLRAEHTNAEVQMDRKEVIKELRDKLDTLYKLHRGIYRKKVKDAIKIQPIDVLK